jgi:hypothetical protein
VSGFLELGFPGLADRRLDVELDLSKGHRATSAVTQVDQKRARAGWAQDTDSDGVPPCITGDARPSAVRSDVQETPIHRCADEEDSDPARAQTGSRLEQERVEIT